MFKTLASFGIDWSNAVTFFMLWFAFSFIVLGFIGPRHGGWNKRVDWSMYTHEPVPDWFPIPLFHADAEKRVVKGARSSLVRDEHIILGVTTHAEWAGTADTIRVGDATGAIVEMRRNDVVVMPIRADKNDTQSFQFPAPVSAPRNRKDRFPADISGYLQREPARTDHPEFDLMNMHARYPRGAWAKATLFRFDDGSLIPESATLHLRGISLAATVGMAKAAFLGAIPAFFGTWLLQAMSRVIERESKRP